MCEYCEGWMINATTAYVNHPPDGEKTTDIDFNFCPMCGRPLREPEALTLEQLDAMKDTPVWVHEIEKHWADGWCVWIGGEALIPGCETWWYDYGDYNKTWTAYPYRVGGGERGGQNESNYL